MKKLKGNKALIFIVFVVLLMGVYGLVIHPIVFKSEDVVNTKETKEKVEKVESVETSTLGEKVNDTEEPIIVELSPNAYICDMVMEEYSDYPVYQVTSALEFAEAVGSDRIICIERSDDEVDYNLAATVTDNPSIEGATISGVNNLIIVGDEDDPIRFVTSDEEDVLSFVDCEGIRIIGLDVGHIAETSCSGSVISVVDSVDVSIENSILFGCGYMGIKIRGESLVSVSSSVIWDCTWVAIDKSTEAMLNLYDTHIYNVPSVFPDRLGNSDSYLVGTSMVDCVIEAPMFNNPGYLFGGSYYPFGNTGVSWFDGTFMGLKMENTLYLASTNSDIDLSNPLEDIVYFIEVDSTVTKADIIAQIESIYNQNIESGLNVSSQFACNLYYEGKVVVTLKYNVDSELMDVSDAYYLYTKEWFGIESIDLEEAIALLWTGEPQSVVNRSDGYLGMMCEMLNSRIEDDELIHTIEMSYLDMEMDHAQPTFYYTYSINQTTGEKKILLDDESAYVCLEDEKDQVREAYLEWMSSETIRGGSYLLPVYIEDGRVRCYVIGEDNNGEIFGYHPVIIDFIDDNGWKVEEAKVKDLEVEPTYLYSADGVSSLFAMNILDKHELFDGIIDHGDYSERWQWMFGADGDLQDNSLYESYNLDDYSEDYDRIVKISQALYHDNDDYTIVITLDRLVFEDEVRYKISKYTIDLENEVQRVIQTERETLVYDYVLEDETALFDSYYEGSIEWYTSVNWVSKGDSLIDNLTNEPTDVFEFDRDNSMRQWADKDDEFTLYVEDTKIPLFYYEDEINFSELFGKALSSEVIRADSDTVYVGTHSKNVLYEGFELGLNGTQFIKGPYMIFKMRTSLSDVRTYRGVGVGDSLEDLLKAYPDCQTYEGDLNYYPSEPSTGYTDIFFETDGKKVTAIVINHTQN